MGSVHLFGKGEYDKAVIELNKCLSMVPEFSPAYNLRGKAHAVRGRYPEAETDFKKVIALSPNMVHGYKNLGFLYLLKGENELAGKYLEAAIRLFPQDQKVRKALQGLNEVNNEQGL